VVILRVENSLTRYSDVALARSLVVNLFTRSAIGDTCQPGVQDGEEFFFPRTNERLSSK
jgi:hypothetical protein